MEGEGEGEAEGGGRGGRERGKVRGEGPKLDAGEHTYLMWPRQEGG